MVTSDVINVKRYQQRAVSKIVQEVVSEGITVVG
jgi:hypothetical protein